MSARRHLPGEYEIVPNGVVLPAQADPGGREHRVVFIGRHDPRKGLSVLLRAWPEIHRRTGARLRLVGTDPLQYRLLHARLRVDEAGIDVLGVIPDEALTRELLSAKLLVSPALGGESFGMVLTRAFACAAPAVASDIPGYAAVATADAARLVPPGASGRSRTRSSSCSRTRTGVARWAPPRAPSPRRGTRGATSRGASRRRTSGSRHERKRLARGWRLLLLLPLLAGSVAIIWWRGPEWGAVHDAFTVVRWRWVVAAVGLNLLSVAFRAIAWRTAIRQAMPPPHPAFRLVFSAFSVGLFANAVLPGRVGELARVAVLTRRMPGREGAGVTLIGSVFAHRVFDLFPVVALVVVGAAVGEGAALGDHEPADRARDRVRPLRVRARERAPPPRPDRRRSARPGSSSRERAPASRVMRAPLPAATAAAFQCLGWTCQLLAVYAAMRAFHIYQPLAAAGLVLVLMNLATIFPLWPGNIGLVQAAVALPLVSYGVAYARGFAFGIGLQAIEASVGVGVGLLFLAREGLSYAVLKEIPEATETEVDRSRRPWSTKMRALASPASLKGVLSPARPRPRSPPACAALRASRRSRRPSQTAARGPPTSWRPLSAGSGARQRRGRAGATDDGALPAAPGRHGGARVGGGDRARKARAGERDPLVASSRGLGELILAALATRPAALLVCVGGTATVDGGAAMRTLVEPWCATFRFASPATCAARSWASVARARLRPAEGRRRPRRCSSSRSASRRWRSSRRTASYPARAPAAASAPRSPRSAASSCRAPTSCST